MYVSKLMLYNGNGKLLAQSGLMVLYDGSFVVFALSELGVEG